MIGESPDPARRRTPCAPGPGFAIGGIPPFGHAIAMPAFLDEDLLGYDIVWAAAGTPSAVFSVEPRALAQAIGAKVMRVT